MHVLKDMNQLEPFCLTERKFNKSLERKLLFPKNPSFQIDDHFKTKAKNAIASKEEGGTTHLSSLHSGLNAAGDS